jgi:hypothetical protein
VKNNSLLKKQNMKTIVIISAILFLSACSSTAKFPVSELVPAANITAKKKQDKNKNFIIELTAYNLAEPSRLSPPKNVYSVWIVAENGTTKNVGQLINENAKKAVLESTTPFNVKEIFITAEETGDLSYPQGKEISRTTFNK